ncbi:hypothetical protein AHAS_Ahas17G0074100 [Arachis hypogaea]
MRINGLMGALPQFQKGLGVCKEWEGLGSAPLVVCAKIGKGLGAGEGGLGKHAETKGLSDLGKKCKYEKLGKLIVYIVYISHCLPSGALLGYEHEMYRLDHAEHIVGRLDRVALRILRTRRNLMTRPPEQIRRYLRRAGFEYVHHQGRTIEELCDQILGVVPGLEDRQSQTKWTMKLTWFHNTVCGEMEQDATEEHLMRYTRGYIMQLIGGILFPDASDSRVHIRWLPLLEDLDTCGWLKSTLGCHCSSSSPLPCHHHQGFRVILRQHRLHHRG